MGRSWGIERKPPPLEIDIMKNIRLRRVVRKLLLEHPDGLTIIEIKSKLYDSWKSYNHLAPRSSSAWAGLMQTDPEIVKVGMTTARGFVQRGTYTLWGHRDV